MKNCAPLNEPESVSWLPVNLGENFQTLNQNAPSECWNRTCGRQQKLHNLSRGHPVVLKYNIKMK